MEAIKSCKVYTPKNVANFMLDKLNLDFSNDFMVLEPAVGTGYIFLELIKRYLDFSRNLDLDVIKYTLENNFYAYDIEKSSIAVLINSLNSLLCEYNVNIKINWKIFEMDILSKEESEKLYHKFSHIICNPPYIKYNDFSSEQKAKVLENKYDTILLNNYDMYLIFIEEITKYLIDDGIASIVVPLNYLRAKYAKLSIASLMNNSLISNLYVFEDNNIFKDISPLSCVFTLTKAEYCKIHYMDKNFNVKNTSDFQVNSHNAMAFDENLMVPISTYCHVNGSIAPLDNSLFFIKNEDIINKSDKFITFKKNDKEYKLSNKYIRKCTNINEKKGNEEFYIVFPYYYDNGFKKINLKNNKSLYKYLSENCKSKEKMFYGKLQNLLNYEDEKLCYSCISSQLKPSIIDFGYVYSSISFTVKEEYKDYKQQIYESIKKAIIDQKEEIFSSAIIYSGGYYNLSTTKLKKIYIPKVGEYRE